MPDINKPLLRSKIIRSRELTALEKRYLEDLITFEPKGVTPIDTGRTQSQSKLAQPCLSCREECEGVDGKAGT
jgi:hypothetical protein